MVVCPLDWCGSLAFTASTISRLLMRVGGVHAFAFPFGHNMILAFYRCVNWSVSDCISSLHRLSAKLVFFLFRVDFSCNGVKCLNCMFSNTYLKVKHDMVLALFKSNSFKIIYLFTSFFCACSTHVKMQMSRRVDSSLVVGCLHFTLGFHGRAVLF